MGRRVDLFRFRRCRGGIYHTSHNAYPMIEITARRVDFLSVLKKAYYPYHNCRYNITMSDTALCIFAPTGPLFGFNCPVTIVRADDNHFSLSANSVNYLISLLSYVHSNDVNLIVDNQRVSVNVGWTDK